MKDPYQVLGVDRSASTQQIKTAYRSLAKKYHPDNYAGNPLQDVAQEKMQEINEAYDAIIAEREHGSGSSDAGGYSYGYGYSSSSSSYTDTNNYSYIRNLIENGRLDDAEILLEQIPLQNRDAQWYYLKGRVNYNRGWVDKAYSYFSTAYKMDPNNMEYRTMYQNIQNDRSGGYRRAKKSRDTDCLECCCDLYCLDSICECFGGDLIPCC